MGTVQGLREIVEYALAYTPGLVDDNIDVAVHGGVVTLTGHVPSYTAKLAAERAAKRLRGVKAIANDLTVQLPGSDQRNDTDIAEAAVGALEWDNSVPHENIKVIVRRGWITLEGELDWQYQKRAAERAVRNLTGALGVGNNLRIRQDIVPSQVQEKIREYLERSARVDADSIEVETEGHTVKLSGTVRSWSERDDAEEAAWSVPGVWEVEDRLNVRHPD